MLETKNIEEWNYNYLQETARTFPSRSTVAPISQLSVIAGTDTNSFILAETGLELAWVLSATLLATIGVETQTMIVSHGVVTLTIDTG